MNVLTLMVTVIWIYYRGLRLDQIKISLSAYIWNGVWALHLLMGHNAP